MRFDIVTLFPKMFTGPFDASILKRAVDSGAIETGVHDLRSWTTDKHQVTDDYPYGGGPGMVMKVEPIAAAVEDLRSKRPGSKTVLMTPQGALLTQRLAGELARLPGVIIVCGRYEGVDERVRAFCDMEISIGDYVLTGGEIPAMTLVDAVARLVPGVLGDERSTHEESHSGHLLEYPHYTRPADFRGMTVPEALLSGDHKRIEQWRREKAILRTAERRPDLFEKADITGEERRRAMETLRARRERS